jgi:putative ABC transport system permease protein
MKTNYIKQAWESLKQDPMVSIISVLGTALSIFLIMIVVLMTQVKYVPFAPESNRDRILLGRSMSFSILKSPDNVSSGSMGEALARELFGGLKTAEKVSLFQYYDDQSLISAKNATPMVGDIKQTDDVFWQIYNFDFIAGKPYDKADFDAVLKKAVISEGAANKIFGTTDVVGRVIEVNHIAYTICGVVHNVSSLAESSYSQLWIPYSTTDARTQAWGDDGVKLGGIFSAAILAHSTADIPKIKAESQRRFNAYNVKLKEKGYKLNDLSNPLTSFEAGINDSSNLKPNPKHFYTHQAMIIAILLLVPTINLSSMTQSRLRRRISEIGIKRAFGCRRISLMNNIITENLILSIVAGIIGLLLCAIFAFFFSDMLFSPDWKMNLGRPTVNFGVLLNVRTFLCAFVFCFILNLLSSIIPAWRAAHTNVVNAINGRTR